MHIPKCNLLPHEEDVIDNFNMRQYKQMLSLVKKQCMYIPKCILLPHEVMYNYVVLKIAMCL